MVPKLTLTIHRVSDVQLKNCFLERKTPKLYVEIETSESELHGKTKVVRHLDAQWEEEFTLDGIDENQIIGFRLRRSHTFSPNRMIGKADSTISDLVTPSGISSIERNLTLYGIKDMEKRRPIGTLVVSAKCIYPLGEEKGSSENEEQISDKDGIPSEEIQEASRPESPSKREELPPKAPEHKAADRAFNAAKMSLEEQLGPDSIYKKVGKVLEKLELLSGIVSKVDELAKLHPWVDFAWQVCSSLYKIVQQQQLIDRRVFDLIATIESTFDFIEDAKKVKEDAIRLESIITAMLNQVTECATFMCTYLRPGFAKRVVAQQMSDSNKKIDEFNEAFAKLRECLMEKVQLHTALVSSKILGGVEQLLQSDALNLLRPAVMDAASRPLCLHGTRRVVLQKIIDWVMDVHNNGGNILWLHGLAGSGKSTIANTIASRIHEVGRRGAFLFFERNKTDRDAVVRTMAAQLADADPFLRSRICAAIDKDRSVAYSPLGKQFAHLVRHPLDEAAPSLLGPIVIVFDALDEYGDTPSRQSLLSLIKNEFTKLPSNFRFLITSRPELDIKYFLSENPKIESISLTDMTDSIPEIRLYLSSELTHIRNVKRISSDWPNDRYINWAARMSEGLFIWASTLSKFLLESHDPAETLNSVLYSNNKEHARGLDQLYATVLNARNGWYMGLGEQFRAVAMIVLTSEKPLSDIDIDRILGCSQAKSCRSIFEDFHCLFDHSPGWPIRLLHASFGDYLTDVTRSGGQPWSLTECDVDSHLVWCCLHVMSKQLRFNICNFETAGRSHREYPDLKERVEKHISPELRYALMAWWRHLKEIRTWREDVGSALRSFSKEKILFWLEAVSLVNDVFSAHAASKFAYEFFMDEDSETATLWTQLRRFLAEHYEAIEDNALHVYVSVHCSPFTEIHDCCDTQLETSAVAELIHNHDVFFRALPNTISCEHYLTCSPDRLILLSHCSFGYLSIQSKLLCDDGSTQSNSRLVAPYYQGNAYYPPEPNYVSVSPNCRRVARSIKHEIYIWDVETGQAELRCTLLEMVHALAFHPLDSNQLAILSSNMISVYNLTGRTPPIRHSLVTEETRGDRCGLVWSPNGTYLASRGSKGADVWSINMTTATITLLRKFGGCQICNPCFSPMTKSHILLVSSTGVSLYDYRSGKQVIGPSIVNDLRPIPVFRNAVFSPDGSLIAASSDYTIQIFEIELEKPYQDPIMAPGRIRQVTFLPDGKQIAAVIGNKVYTWELCHGSQVSDHDRFDRANMRGHFRHVTSTSFSPDGTKFLSSSDDGTVQVRSSTDCMLLREYWPMEYQHSVTSAVFGADNKTVYLALGDGTIQTSLGKVLYRRKGPGKTRQIFNFYVYVSPLTSEEHIIFSLWTLSKEALIIHSNGNPEQEPRKICFEGDHFIVSSNGLLASFSYGSDEIKVVNLEEDPGPSSYSLYLTKYGRLVSVLFSQMGEVLVSLGYWRRKYGITIWDTKTASVSRTLEISVKPVMTIPRHVALNTNLLALTFQFTILIYNIEDGTLLHTFILWNPIIDHIDIHDSKLVSASEGHIIMWDLSAPHNVGTTPHADATSTPTSVHSSTVPPWWSIRCADTQEPTGWILGSAEEKLLWAHDWLRKYLDPPGSTHVIQHRRVKLPDFIPDMDWLKSCEGVGRLSVE
ncbi:hypothetical protein QCA50_012474 [Cerrena zonata]|uniref:C2 domain-containing protein n=1 Tax=Cerrena zonata TaxID=2478898 RepID=A0AAW0FYX5_9APHY